ncbi:hypothetical protein MGYG_00382 [Nannizzia gypsea CBS 118893]|uniref:Tetrapyrrole biosynthesis uroporphyrinogen III synthase domain-containing protein n=1 Tax=Arthroderma gypseum (strain ATCC MYA-4604 / CBS 118893) TaxID=535722 RepID=E5QZH7_ARTGP|nr:hypothetical protein MGYG_00382 [Nannizzia gypsea CBS 118893]EFQ97343.1 hypothetical protein MGYG_00382 [Nannizzia gypsea CBS 118893]
MSSLPVTREIPIYFLKTKSTPHDGYKEYFSPTKGFKPYFVPVLEHKFNRNNLAKVKDLILSGALTEQYGGIIFTSQRAVEGFSKMIQDEVGIDSYTVNLSRSLSFYSVGPATYRSLKSLCDVYFPHSQVIGEEAGTGERLASLIIPHYNGLQQGISDENAPLEAIKKEKLPLLFLVGEQHRDIIPKTLMSPSLGHEARIGVDTMVVYETGVMESFGQDFVAALEKQDQGYVDIPAGNKIPHKQLLWVVVFSPSGCEAMLRHLGLLEESRQPEEDKTLIHPVGKRRTSSRWSRFDCRIATIGPTTRDHLVSNFGVQPDVCAEKPSPEGLAEGIEPIIAEWNRSEEQDR